MEQHRVTTCGTGNTYRNNSNEDFSVNIFSVASYPPTRPDIEVSDGDKAGATLLFSGVFLGLVGITFTGMGWINYDTSKNFEWTQLLGPILLSVGVTFVLIGVCKFNMLTCKLCKQCDETEPPQPGQSFVFTGINQPFTFHSATLLQCIPPPNIHEAGTANNVSTRGTFPGLSRTTFPPQYCTIYPLDNPLFSDDDHCTPSLEMDINNSRNHENEERPDGKTSTDETVASSAPPAYEDIFPVTLNLAT